jgi:hypothetical protein
LSRRAASVNFAGLPALQDSLASDPLVGDAPVSSAAAFGLAYRPMRCSSGATQTLWNSQSISQNARNAAGGPRSPEARCCEPLGIECRGNHGLRIQPPPFQPANGAPGFLGASSIESGPNVERGLGMCAAMPAH